MSDREETPELPPPPPEPNDEISTADEIAALDPSLAPELLDADGLPPLKHQWRVFAMSFADPTSPSFGKRIESYLNAYPHVTRESAERRAFVLLANTQVRAEIARLQIQNVAAVGLTKEQYLRHCLLRERFLMARGGRGDASAAAAILKLIGQAAGFLVHRTEDMTPPERRQLTGEQLAQTVFEAADRWRRLREPAATQELPPGPPPADWVAPPGMCWWCHGKRPVKHEHHFSGHPTCEQCDWKLSDERYAYRVAAQREQALDPPEPPA